MATALAILGIIALGSLVAILILCTFMLLPIAVESYVEAKKLLKKAKEE